MALMEESLTKKRIGGPTTKLFKETSTPANAAVQRLRGIHISELYGTTINPDPRDALDAFVDKKLASSSSSSSIMRGSKQQRQQQKQKEISASASKSEYVVDKDVVVTEHLTENLMRQLTGCDDLSTLRGLEMKISATTDSTVGNFASYLPQLRKLKLSDSAVTCMREVGTGFNNLRVLWMSRCGLEDLDGVSAMHNLKEVYLSYNLINDLSPCGMLDSLEVLDLEGNTIDDVDQVDFLSLCTSLTHLTLEGNPVNLMPTPFAASDVGYDYRRRVFDAVPHLQYLDDVKLEKTTTTTTKMKMTTTTTTKDEAGGSKSKKSPTITANLTPDFAENWAFINSFLGNGGGAGGGGGGSGGGGSGGSGALEASGSSAKESGAATVGLTVRDICGGDAEELYRKTAAGGGGGGGEPPSQKGATELKKTFASTSRASDMALSEPALRNPALTEPSSPTNPPTQFRSAASSTRTPAFRIRSTIVTSSRRPPTTSSSARHPSTSGRPSTSSSAPSSAAGVVRPGSSSGVRPQTAPHLIEEEEEQTAGEGGGGGIRATYSELTVGATVCGSISRSLKSRSKKSLPTFIDLDPESSSSRRPESKGIREANSGTSGTSGTSSDARAAEAGGSDESGSVDASDSRDDLDLNPLKYSSSSASESRKSSGRSFARSSSSSSAAIASIDKIEEEEEKEEGLDDDFVIHVVDSAQNHAESVVAAARPRSAAATNHAADANDNHAVIVGGGAIPKLLRVPTPPTASKTPSMSASGASSGASARRARLAARLSADGKLQSSSSTASSVVLPPLNPLKKSF